MPYQRNSPEPQSIVVALVIHNTPTCRCALPPTVPRAEQPGTCAFPSSQCTQCTLSQWYRSNGAVRACTVRAVQVCHALGNLARVKALQQGILEAGVAEAVQRFEADPEVRE